MKYLFLLRHAKSSWANAGLADCDRPLNKRGLRDAPRMGQWLSEYTLHPETIVSSPAMRARITAETMAETMGQLLGLQTANISISINDQIYEATSQQLLTVIQGLSDQCDRVMIVGHNPSLTELVNWLDGVRIDNVPTCGLAILKCQVKRWSEVMIEKAELVTFQYPRNLHLT